MDGTETRRERWRAAIAAAGLVLAIILMGLVKDRLEASSRYLVGPLRIRLGPLPAVLEEHRGRLLADVTPVTGRRSLFDPTLARDVRERLLGLPWVRSVSRIRRRLPDALEVDLDLRLPFAVVCIGAERLAVDQEGVVLEADTTFGPPYQPEIHLPGEDIRRVPVDGRPFGNASVLEALAVLRDVIRASRGGHAALETFRIACVMVGKAGSTRSAGAADIVLVLDNGVELAWGRSSLAPLHVFDPSPGEKLEHLARTLRAYPGLLGVGRVDLRSQDPLVYPGT